MPYCHSRCLILKLHGDYLDTRLRNTEEELSKYPKKLSAYLSRILDDHGLVIGGWSGEYDFALVNQILNAPNRRFGLYWLRVGELKDTARKIVFERRGTDIEIASADTAFEQLLQQVDALRELETPSPLDIATLAAVVKRYIPRDEYRIQLYELIQREVQMFSETLNDKGFERLFNLRDGKEFVNEYVDRVARYEASLERLAVAAMILIFHGPASYHVLIIEILELLSRQQREPATNFVNSLERYPAFLFLYCAGTAAMAAGKFDFATTILHEAQVLNPFEHRKVPIVTELRGTEILGFDQAQNLFPENVKNGPRRSPIDDHILLIITKWLTYLYVDSQNAEEAFSQFHYLLQLAYIDFKYAGDEPVQWIPPGRYGRHSYNAQLWSKSPEAEIEKLLLKNPPENFLIEAGFFGGDFDRFLLANRKLREFLVKKSEDLYRI